MREVWGTAHSQQLDRPRRQIRLLPLPPVRGTESREGASGGSLRAAPERPKPEAGSGEASWCGNRGQPGIQEVDGCEADCTIEGEAHRAGYAPPADNGQVPLGSVL